MVKLAAAGSNEFIVGFRLAGIKDTIELAAGLYNELKSLKERKDIGIVIVEEKIINRRKRKIFFIKFYPKNPFRYTKCKSNQFFLKP